MEVEEVGWHVRKESALDLGRGNAREERSLRGCQRRILSVCGIVVWKFWCELSVLALKVGKCYFSVGVRTFAVLFIY